MFQVTRKLDEPFRHIWTEDPAVNQDHQDYNPDEYLKTGEDKYLPVREGERPTVFHCKGLSRAALTMVYTKIHAEDFLTGQQIAVAYGLDRIENGGDEACELDKERTHAGMRIKDKQLDAIFHVDLFTELASRILAASTARPF